MTEPPALRVAIVTPVHNRREITLQCLRSIGRLDVSGIDLRVIVVDDGSTDGTAAQIGAHFPGVEVVQGNGDLFYTAGSNLGIRAALEHSPDYVLAINDDSIFHRLCLQRLVACAAKHPRSVVGALLLLWDTPHRVFQVGAWWDTWFGGWRHPSNLTAFNVPRSAFAVEIIVGNCVLYPVEVIREAGLMNEHAFPYGFGDVEYTPRMRRRGWRLLIEPSAYVWCQPNSVPSPLKRKSIVGIARELFADPRSPRSLVRMFRERWYSAPSRPLGVLAFVVVLWRMAFYAAGVGGPWPRWPDPEPEAVTKRAGT